VSCPPPGPGHPYVASWDSRALVPAGLDDCSTSSPFVYLTLSALRLLSTRDVVIVVRELAANAVRHGAGRSRRL
jgi:hypothetical protein